MAGLGTLAFTFTNDNYNLFQKLIDRVHVTCIYQDYGWEGQFADFAQPPVNINVNYHYYDEQMMTLGLLNEI